MADHLDVDTDVLNAIGNSLDDVSELVEVVSIPHSVDGGKAGPEIELFIADLLIDLSSLASGTHAMSLRLHETRQLYIDRDIEAAEALFLPGDSE